MGLKNTGTLRGHYNSPFMELPSDLKVSFDGGKTFVNCSDYFGKGDGETNYDIPPDEPEMIDNETGKKLKRLK